MEAEENEREAVPKDVLSGNHRFWFLYSFSYLH